MEKQFGDLIVKVEKDVVTFYHLFTNQRGEQKRFYCSSYYVEDIICPEFLAGETGLGLIGNEMIVPSKKIREIVLWLDKVTK